MKTTIIDGAYLTPETIDILKTIQEGGEGYPNDIERSIDLILACYNEEQIDPAKILRAVSNLRQIRDMFKILSNREE